MKDQDPSAAEKLRRKVKKLSDELTGTNTSHGMETRVTRLETAVERIEMDIGQANRMLGEIKKDLASANKPNWQAAGFAVGVMGILLGIAGAMIGYVINDLSTDIQAHVSSPGHTQALLLHARTDERINTLAERVEANDDHDEWADSKIDTLERWTSINSEIDATQTERINELMREHERYRDQLEAVRTDRWTSVQGLETRDRVARLEARLATLEALLEETRNEQVRRTNRVYQEPEKQGQK